MANPSPTFTSSTSERKEEVVAEEPKLKPHDIFSEFSPTDDKYKERVRNYGSTPPTSFGWSPFMNMQFNGFWHGEPFFHKVLKMQEGFKPQPSDVIVASFPKTGTTWLKALVFTLIHRRKYDFSSHPLLKRNPHDIVPSLEQLYALGDEEYLESLPSPRVLGTHMPYSALPESIRASKCPIVYICREPKDIIVSFWHMVIKGGRVKETFTFNQAFDLFCEGRVVFGPVWEHVLEYYKKSLESAEKILFLKYEEMMNNPTDGVIRLSEFIGQPFSEEEVKNGVVEEIVEFCSFKKLKDLDVNREVKNAAYFRKAVVGDWQNYMTPEMATKLDEITDKKMRDTGFTFGVASA